jgi:hypothetical protein
MSYDDYDSFRNAYNSNTPAWKFPSGTAARRGANERDEYAGSPNNPLNWKLSPDSPKYSSDTASYSGGSGGSFSSFLSIILVIGLFVMFVFSGHRSNGVGSSDNVGAVSNINAMFVDKPDAAVHGFVIVSNLNLRTCASADVKCNVLYVLPRDLPIELVQYINDKWVEIAVKDDHGRRVTGYVNRVGIRF